MMQAEMNHADREAARERLSDQVFSAKTLAEIMAVKQALRQWLMDHPDEPGMADGFEVLSHRQDFAEQREAIPTQPKEKHAKTPLHI
jgi:hypothetical protein